MRSSCLEVSESQEICKLIREARGAVANTMKTHYFIDSFNAISSILMGFPWIFAQSVYLDDSSTWDAWVLNHKPIMQRIKDQICQSFPTTISPA